MVDRSTPFAEIAQLFDRLQTQIEEVSESVKDQGQPVDATDLDLIDDGESYIVHVNVPGYEEDDIDIHLVGRTLHISGHRESYADEQDSEYIRRERRTATFDRQLNLPESVDSKAADARIENGILTIELEKVTQSHDPQSIDIE